MRWSRVKGCKSYGVYNLTFEYSRCIYHKDTRKSAFSVQENGKGYRRRGGEGEGGIIMSPVEEDKKEGCLSTIEIITEVRERFYTTFYSSYSQTCKQ